MADNANTKLNIFQRIAKYFRDTRAEFKKIVWPTWKQLVNNTWIVILAIVIIGAVIFALDALFGFLFGLILG